MRLTVSNNRKHVVQLGGGLEIPPLGSLDIEKDVYDTIRVQNKQIQEAVDRGFLKATIKEGGKKK